MKKKVKNYNVMIVEDEILANDSLSRQIESLNDGMFVVSQATNGKEALALLKKTDIHVIVTDIRMPEMDGLELARIVHQQFPHIVTIVLTGYADFNYAKEALKQGVCDYLLKPVDTDELENSLSSACLLLDKYYEIDGNSTFQGNSTEDIVNYTILYIREHYMDDIDFSVLSNKLGFSSAYLTKIFGKYVHVTPLRYLTNVRINEAKHLLLNTNLSIREIGEKVGYPDQFYFSKTFRKIVGINPTTFRSQHSVCSEVNGKP